MNILLIEDNLSIIKGIKYNLEQISKEQTLKGIFVKELLDQMNEENKEQILESIYIGLALM